MAEFRKCFHAIDTENTGVITVEDLRAYMHRMHYKEQFVSKWISLFDPKNEGLITYENYCRTLGLIPRRPTTGQTAGSSKDEAKATAERSAQPVPASEKSVDLSKPDETVVKLQESTPSHEQSVGRDDTVSPKHESPKSRDQESKNEQRSKLSHSDHPEEPDVQVKSPDITEDPIIPSVCLGTTPSFPQETAVEQPLQPQVESNQDQKPKRSKAGRKSTSSQSEESLPVMQRNEQMPEQDKTEMDFITPQVVSSNMEEKSSTRKQDSKPSKKKDRKSKQSQSSEEAEPHTQLQPSEEVIEPDSNVSMQSTPPVEPVLPADSRNEKKRKRQKSRNSQSEQSPSTKLPLSTETPEHSKYTEEPMQVIEDVTPVSTSLSAAVPVQELDSKSEAFDELHKDQKANLPESGEIDEGGKQGALTVGRDAVPPEEVSSQASVSLQEPHKAQKSKKSRAKKSSQSHSESHDTAPEAPNIDQFVEEKVVAEQTSQVATSIAPKLTQVEPKQSTTPLLSPAPIPPSEQFVCVGALDTTQPSPLFHDFSPEMEMQLLSAVNPASTTEHSVSIAEPVKTSTAVMDSAQKIEEIIVPAPIVSSSSVQATHSKPKPAKKQGKSVADQDTSKIEHRITIDKHKRKLPEQSKIDSQDTSRSAQKEVEEVKKKKVEIQKSAAKEKSRAGDGGREKKVTKQKHEDEKNVKSDKIPVPQMSDKSKSLKSDALPKLKRVKPVSAGRLKDKKRKKSTKDEMASTIDEKESDEPKKKKARFPRSFMVQLDPERCARKSKLALRQHERRLQRKIDRIEKRVRKSRKIIKPKYRWKVRPSLRSRGVIVILLAGRHRGKRVVCLGRQRSTGLLLVTGPFRYNGCPLRRVHPNMVIATKTCVNLNKLTIPCRIHKKGYFARKTQEAKRRKLDDSVLLKLDDKQERGYRPDEQRKADQKLIDAAVCTAIKSHEDSRMLIKYLKSLFSIGKYDRPHKMVF